MDGLNFRALLSRTLFAPREAAAHILALDLPRQWLWTALALMVVLNAISHALSLQLSPPDPAVALAIPPVFRSPVLFAGFLFVSLTVTIFALSWTGRLLGGAAAPDDILALTVWLQVLRLLLQLAVTLLILMSFPPFPVMLLVLVASFWGLVILVAFVDAAHRFDNLLKSFGVLVLSMIATVVALVFAFSALITVFLGAG